MKEDTDNNIIILRHIKGELSDEEQHAFEQRMAIDAEFAEEVAFAKEYHAFQEREEFEAALKTFHQEKKEEGFFEKIEQQITEEAQTSRPKPKKSIARWFPIAAAAILIGLVLAWLLPRQALNTSEEIIAEVVEIPNKFVNARAGQGFNGKDSIPIQILKTAVEAYGNEKYQAAAKGFEACLESAKTDTGIEFYLAKCYLLMQPPQTDKAISMLENISEKGLYKREIILHLGAAYIRRGEQDKAIRFLKQEHNNTTNYLDELSNLIKEAQQKKQ